MSFQAKNLATDKHCFFGAEGGVSEGIYASLNTNLSSRDKRENVLQNFDIIAAQFGMQRDNFATVRQAVSSTAVWIEEPTWFEIIADGMATNKPNVLLGIKTADCAPVLLTDCEHGIIGAAHAGWRGAYKGVVENTVRLMIEHGAKVENIHAAVGPCMQQKSFEVKADMRDVLLANALKNAKYFASRDGQKFYFDLSGFVVDKLRQMGIESVENALIDTYSSAQYFSFRRNTHAGLISVKKDYPTQFSCIRL